MNNPTINPSANPIVDPHTTPGTVPIIDVTIASTGQRVTVNVSDYNPAIHSSPTKSRLPVGGDDHPLWYLDPANGGSVPIQVTVISSGATAVIWSSTYNASLHSNPKYTAGIEVAAGVVRLNQQGKIYTPTPPGPFAEPTRDLLGPTFAINVPSRALQFWPSAWQLPSLYKSDYEAGGGSPTLT